MNELYKNRDKSRKLPFDVMNIIYEYADPMLYVKKQIVNKEYDLDEIMYKRYLKEIRKDISRGLGGINIDFYTYIDHTNMYEEKYKQHILNYYKQLILYNERYRIRICGLYARIDSYCHRSKIIMDLETNGIKVNRKHSKKQLYKKWVKL